MTARLLVNENFPQPSVRLLRERGVDVFAVVEGMRGAHDEQILASAREQARWLVTFDRDYGELVFTRGHLPPPAIVFIRQEPFAPVRPAELLLDLLAEPDKVSGYFVVLRSASIRRRALPRV